MSPTRGRLPSLLAAAGLLLPVASAGAAPGLTLAAYGKRADADCSQLRRAVEPAGPRVALSDFDGVVRIATGTLRAVLVDNRRLAAIPLPAAVQRPLVLEWLAARESVPALLRKLRAAAQARNTELTFQAYYALENEFFYAGSLARLLGMTGCTFE